MAWPQHCCALQHPRRWYNSEAKRSEWANPVMMMRRVTAGAAGRQTGRLRWLFQAWLCSAAVVNGAAGASEPCLDFLVPVVNGVMLAMWAQSAVCIVFGLQHGRIVPKSDSTLARLPSTVQLPRPLFISQFEKQIAYIKAVLNHRDYDTKPKATKTIQPWDWLISWAT